MKICLEADLHVHSIASGHAFSTIQELSEAAAKRGLKMIALTDHGPSLPGAPHEFYFYRVPDLPKVINGVEVLSGVEANILDPNGTLDVPVKVLGKLDIVLAGFHEDTGYTGTGIEDNTRALIAVLNNPLVDIIVHPGNPKFPIDIDKVVQVARQTEKILEINNSSFSISRLGSSAICQEIIHKAAQNGNYLVINSDAHSSFEVGKTEKALEVVQQAGIESNKILNTSVNLIKEYLRQAKQKRKKTSNS